MSKLGKFKLHLAFIGDRKAVLGHQPVLGGLASEWGELSQTNWMFFWVESFRSCILKAIFCLSPTRETIFSTGEGPFFWRIVYSQILRSENFQVIRRSLDNSSISHMATGIMWEVAEQRKAAKTSEKAKTMQQWNGLNKGQLFYGIRFKTEVNYTTVQSVSIVTKARSTAEHSERRFSDHLVIISRWAWFT